MIRERLLLQDLIQHLDKKQFTIITGARQVGKTSLLQLLFQFLKNRKEKVFFTSLEDPQILRSIDEHPRKILNFLPEQPLANLEGHQEKPIFLLVDEVQYAANPTNFLKYLYDTYAGNLKLIATGSSAFYIDRKFRDSLAGRKQIFPLFPLSFEEFLAFNEAKELVQELHIIRENPLYTSLKLELLNRYFFDYLNYGGYPAVVLEREVERKKALLEELKNSYIKRDLLESGVEKEHKFYLLLQILAEQTGGLVNKQELGNTLSIDAKTVDQYLYILQKCFHIHLVRPFFRNLRKELTKMPKIYFNDLGLRNTLLNRWGKVPFRADKGELLENYYFLQLRNVFGQDRLRYWRTTDKQEVDFVIEERYGEGKAYEVKWDSKKFNPHKYRKFTDSYPTFPLECLSARDFFTY